MLNTVAVANFERTLQALVIEIRDILNANHDSDMSFRVEVSGNPSRDLLVKFTFSKGIYGEPTISGDIQTAFSEYLRRRDFHAQEKVFKIMQVAHDEDDLISF